MILQLMIRRPDEELSESLIVGISMSKPRCLETVNSLLEGVLTTEVVSICFSVFPEGCFLEGVAYGELDEDPLDSYDLHLKVLH
jgi:hypothetical protein